jgi:hypothetical protein
MIRVEDISLKKRTVQFTQYFGSVQNRPPKLRRYLADAPTGEIL